MNFLKKVYFHVISSLVGILAKCTGLIHAPWTHKRLSYDDVVCLKGLLRVGDIILTRTDGELTTLTIPGYWKHAIVYIGQDKVVEGVAPFVRENWLANVVMKTDYISVMRMKDSSDQECYTLVEYALSCVGKKYDFGLKIWDEEEEYCSEIVYHGVNKAKRCEWVELRYRMGFPSLTPDDIYKARRKFDFIYEK